MTSMRFLRTVAHRGSGFLIGATVRVQDQDLTGLRFGKLLVLRFSHVSNGGDRMWECQCDCGAISTPTTNRLTCGLSKSCGCAALAGLVALNKTHGLSALPEYKVWCLMRARCNHHPRYAGRGITVCERWQNFTDFLEDMGPRPEGSTIERKNNNGNYEPGNCCWATKLQQGNNKSNNITIELNGIKDTAKAWSRRLGLPYSALLSRLKHGWSDEDALRKPFRNCKSKQK